MKATCCRPTTSSLSPQKATVSLPTSPPSEGYRVLLIRGDNGEVIVPTPSEIEKMKKNGEGEWVEILELSATSHPSPTEEEWKMQEALH